MTTVVQSAGAQYPSSSGSASNILSSNVTTGNTILLFITTGSGTANDVASVTTTGASVTWTKLGSGVNPYDTEVWQGLVTAGGAIPSTAVTMTDASTWYASALEVTGASSFVFASSSGSTASPSLGQSVSSGNLVVAAVTATSWAGTITAAPTSPWTDLNGTSGWLWSWSKDADLAWQVAAGGGTATATWTLSGATTWQCVGVVASASTSPIVVTGAANPVSTTTATLHGTVNPNSLSTTYKFDYGLTTGYGTSTTPTSAGSGSSPVAESVSLTGLTPGTTYHFRVEATSSAGTTYGLDQTLITPIVTSFPYTFGINDHFLRWTSQASWPITDLAALGCRVCRNDLSADAGTGDNTGAIGTSPCTTITTAWVTALRSAGIQPLIVVTWNYANALSGYSSLAANLAALAAANPGVWWEIGNELDYAYSIGDTAVAAATYEPWFAAIVSAMHTADPTCKVGPAPVANTNPAGTGWNWISAAFTAGLASVPYDFLSFHVYAGPTARSPTSYFYTSSYTTETLIPNFTAQCTTWGNTKPYWLTECGWQAVDTSDTPNMTDALQASYMVAYLQAIESYGLAVVTPYALGDWGGQTYGWYVGTWSPARPVVAAVQALEAGTLSATAAGTVSVTGTAAGAHSGLYAGAAASHVSVAGTAIGYWSIILPPDYHPPPNVWADAILADGLQIVTVGEVYAGINGPLLATINTITNGTVKIDQTNANRRTCSDILMAIDASTTYLVPGVNSGDLFPDGGELFLQKGIVYPDGTTEMKPLGRFLIETPKVTRAVNGAGSLVIDLSGTDRSGTVARSLFTQPYATDGVSTVDVAIMAILNMQVPQLTAFAFAASPLVPPVASYAVGDNAWTACQALAALDSKELFFDPSVNAVCILRDIPDATVAPIAAVYNADLSSIITQNTRGLSNIDVPNVILAQSQGSGVAIPLQAMWFDNNPLSPTYYGPAGPPVPPAGSYPTTVSVITVSGITDLPTLQAMANTAGAAQQGRFETCDTYIRDDPARDASDVVTIGDPVLNMEANFVLDSLVVQMGYSTAMEIVGRRVY